MSKNADNAALEKCLKNAADQLCADSDLEFQPLATYVLVLDPKLDKANPHSELPVDAAILINLWRMGAFTQSDLEAALVKIDAEKAKTWLAQFIS